jgi:hypothetical protein
LYVLFLEILATASWPSAGNKDQCI